MLKIDGKVRFTYKLFGDNIFMTAFIVFMEQL